jgi:hypothetical protein
MKIGITIERYTLVGTKKYVHNNHKAERNEEEEKKFHRASLKN